MTPDEVREIVRNEIAKMIEESGLLNMLFDLVSRPGGASALDEWPR